MSLVLRPVRGSDLARLAVLHAACFPDDAWNSAAIATVLAMPGTDGRMCCDDDGAPCGLLLEQCFGPEGEILTLGVAPDARRRGVARSLIADLIDRARSGAVERLLLEVAADNVAALSLYASIGFARQGLRRHYYRRPRGPAVDAWRLCLDLSGPA